MLQEFKADKQNRELQKRQGVEIKKLQEVKGNLDALKAKADVQYAPTFSCCCTGDSHVGTLHAWRRLHPCCSQCNS